MVSGTAPIVLKDKGILFPVEGAEVVDRGAATLVGKSLLEAQRSEPFLRIPPFPGRESRRFLNVRDGIRARDPGGLVEDVRRLRVGGTYWAGQPSLGSDYVVVRSAAAVAAACAEHAERQLVLWQASGSKGVRLADIEVVHGDCDPWHILSSATALVIEQDEELRLIAALLDVPTYVYDPVTAELKRDRADASRLLAEVLPAAVENPFTGELMSVRETVELCGFWRKLIDSNRDIAGGLGFAFWKQDHVAPLLWNGSQPFRFFKAAGDIPQEASVAVWRAKAPSAALAQLERSGHPLIEVEDGFLRSRGLGADCIPPLSITVDRLGAHFDPSRPSELEKLLQNGRFDDALLARARELRQQIVEAGIGKYERGAERLERPGGERRHILVPGQVEDDRAVETGGCGLTSNLDLLRRVRERAPDAYILYKPHPDVLAGHRRGSIPNRICLQYADQIVSELPIGSLIAMADEVHVNTSLAGFEALLRGKRVVAHGVPFYAGWGLTEDLGPVPQRRSATRTIDELVAATLLLYPRYFDPVTGLPCPAEIVVARLRVDEDGDPGLLVGMRRLQGKLMRRLRSLVQ